MFRFLLIALAIVATAGLAWAGPQEPGSVSSDALKAASPGTPSQHVKRAVFTTGVVEREPADEIAALKTDVGKVFFFTEIVGMEGKTIIHRWVYNGETKADVSFQIGGAKWRVYSSKTLIPEWAGAWTVEVVDGEGNTLHKATWRTKRRLDGISLRTSRTGGRPKAGASGPVSARSVSGDDRR